MAVNISAMEFRCDAFLDGVFTILKETGLPSTLLELELTESVLMKNASSTALILKSLKEKDVKLAVDDFGTGYSSLSYLRKLPIDALQIDQSFVRQIANSAEEPTIVAAIISIGRSLKLRVVAEGVETEEELAFLHRNSCDGAQGYLFSPAGAVAAGRDISAARHPGVRRVKGRGSHFSAPQATLHPENRRVN